MVTRRCATVSGRFRVEMVSADDPDQGRPFREGTCHFFVDDVEVSEAEFNRAIAAGRQAERKTRVRDSAWYRNQR
jgi:hypothetical protein